MLLSFECYIYTIWKINKRIDQGCCLFEVPCVYFYTILQRKKKPCIAHGTLRDYWQCLVLHNIEHWNTSILKNFRMFHPFSETFIQNFNPSVSGRFGWRLKGQWGRPWGQRTKILLALFSLYQRRHLIGWNDKTEAYRWLQMVWLY